MADQNERQYFERRKGALINERQSFITHYKELAEFIQPRRGRFFVQDRNKGERRHQSIINSKATQAHRTARSGMLAGTMSPARPWFSLVTPDDDLNEFKPVKIWLWHVTKIIREIFAQSNFYNMSSVMLGELLLFGTGAMSHVDDFENVARFYTHTAGSYCIGQDDQYRVNTFMREFEWTVGQMVSAFGIENVSEAVKAQYDKGNYDSWYPIVQFVEPNPDQNDRSKLATAKSFRSVYYEPGNNDQSKCLSHSGFDEFPVYVPRWDVTGEDIYGTDCPAMTALGDIKGLQIEEKRKAQAIDKMTNPPLKGPSSLRNSPVNSLPGGLTIYDSDGTHEGLTPLYQVNPQIGELRIDIDAVERRIDTAFYVDLFLAISNMEGVQPKNQLELTQRNQERLLMLGPVLERLHNEFLNQLIDRAFNQCLRAGILPPAPEELQGKELKVNYVSSLAMAQRSVATGGIEHLLAFAGSVAALNPGVLHKIDFDQAVDEMADAIGVPPKIIRSDEEVADMRAEEAKKAAQQEQMMMMQQMAATAKDGAAAAKDGAEVMGASGGPGRAGA